MHREYKECRCNITAWSHCGWSNTAVLFPREISLRRIWGRLFRFVSNVPGKELFWKTVLPIAVHLQKRRAQGWVSHLEHQASGLPGEMLPKAPGMPRGVDTLCVSPSPTVTARSWKGTSSRAEADIFTAHLQKQRTIGTGQPALVVRSHQAKKSVQGTPALHTPNTPCWSVQGF